MASCLGEQAGRSPNESGEPVGRQILVMQASQLITVDHMCAGGNDGADHAQQQLPEPASDRQQPFSVADHWLAQARFASSTAGWVWVLQSARLTGESCCCRCSSCATAWKRSGACKPSPGSPRSERGEGRLSSPVAAQWLLAEAGCRDALHATGLFTLVIRSTLPKLPRVPQLLSSKGHIQ